MKRNLIYLDYAASTPVDRNVQKVMLPFHAREFGNPSSVHALGQRSRAFVERAREQVAQFLAAFANEVVFTSGATEANNLAIQGIVRSRALEDKKARLLAKPHVITLAIEHESVLAPIQALEKEGMIEATFIQVGKEGVVNPTDVEKALKKNTKFVSIQYANSEIGTVQPIAEIAKIIKKYKVQDTQYQILFHTDAVQAANYLDCSVEKLGVDLLTLSSHKIYGPKGVGILYIRKGILLHPLFFGGGQEQDIRSGTENVAGIVGMGEAVQELQNPKSEIQNIRIRQLRDKLMKIIPQRISGAELTGSVLQRLPNNVHVRIKGVEGKDVVLLLDQKGIAVSTGSACSERSQEPSHVLRVMGYSDKEALSCLRITLGKHTRKEEVEKTVKILEKTVEQLRGKK